MIHSDTTQKIYKYYAPVVWRKKYLQGIPYIKWSNINTTTTYKNMVKK